MTSEAKKAAEIALREWGKRGVPQGRETLAARCDTRAELDEAIAALREIAAPHVVESIVGADRPELGDGADLVRLWSDIHRSQGW